MRTRPLLLDGRPLRASPQLSPANVASLGGLRGRLEYGPRALGNRSILADPRSADMKDRINLSIKYREEFRPFCPSVLFSRQNEYFEDAFDAPFMVVTFPVDERVKKIIPAVVHVDGTARIQSVHPETNPPYSRLIGEFGKSKYGSDPDQHQPQYQRAADGQFAAGGAAHLFLFGAGVLYLGPYRLSKPA